MKALDLINDFTTLLMERTELSQATARLVVLVPFAFHFMLSHDVFPDTAIAYGVVGLMWLGWIKFHPAPLIIRQWGSMIIDIAAVSALLWGAGAGHVVPFMIYFWIVLDNGYRIGSNSAICAIVGSMVGFWIVAETSPGWRHDVLHVHHLTQYSIGFIVISLFGYKVLNNLERTIEHSASETTRANSAELKASIDQLTGLKNREAAVTLLRDFSNRNARVGVLFVDLDNFKSFNDEHGHHIGDEVLRTISKRLQHSVRAPDTVCRYAGDEFIVIVNDEDKDTVETVAKRVQSALNRQIRTSDAANLPVTGSIGVAILGIHGSTASEVLKNADAAMYMAKRAGRNKIAWFEEKIGEII